MQLSTYLVDFKKREFGFELGRILFLDLLEIAMLAMRPYSLRYAPIRRLFTHTNTAILRGKKATVRQIVEDSAAGISN